MVLLSNRPCQLFFQVARLGKLYKHRSVNLKNDLNRNYAKFKNKMSQKKSQHSVIARNIGFAQCQEKVVIYKQLFRRLRLMKHKPPLGLNNKLSHDSTFRHKGKTKPLPVNILRHQRSKAYHQLDMVAGLLRH